MHERCSWAAAAGRGLVVCIPAAGHVRTDAALCAAPANTNKPWQPRQGMLQQPVDVASHCTSSSPSPVLMPVSLWADHVSAGVCVLMTCACRASFTISRCISVMVIITTTGRLHDGKFRLNLCTDTPNSTWASSSVSSCIHYC